jgi:hypothetical protein
MSKQSGSASHPPIQVFLPDWERPTDGAFYQDGLVQERGFVKAVQDADSIPNKLPVSYQRMYHTDSAETLLGSMKRLYTEQGSTFFVMTMSTKVEAVRKGFIAWHRECVCEGKPAPVLIATVASAPDLADISGGVVRWYVRSEEESSLLAEYVHWKLGVSHAVVFYITRNAGQADDSYGQRGMEVFRNRFLALGGATAEAHSVTAATAKSEVEHFLTTFKTNAPDATREVAAFVVGYGEMVKATVHELILQGFQGPIVCASTLTEPDWQPADCSADHRMFTVLPRLKGVDGRLDSADRNVVFFFAKLSLRRVLEWTAEDPDPRKFLERWPRGAKESPLDEEYLANGDIIVNLEAVEAERWR